MRLEVLAATFALCVCVCVCVCVRARNRNYISGLSDGNEEECFL